MTTPVTSPSTSYPSTLYFSEDFVVSAGCVLFRKNTGLEICLLHDLTKEAWVLPKGRKDCGESIAAAAVRETFEEIGYPCALLPLRMPTRAPVPGVNGADASTVVEDISEPIAVVVEDRGSGGEGLKLVWWYVARCTGERVSGTQAVYEQGLQAVWVRMDDHEAVGGLTFESHREVIRRAVELVGRAEWSDKGV
ncbi:NUDIX hydrolase domain-like protein [Mycena sanguinolenta]|nr:NUDIX hydrolase domain-like protein [Mycena sanguinolenta]